MTKKKTPIKRSHTLIILITILIISLVGWIFVKNDNRYNTRNWNRYGFNQLGFSLKLPPDWVIFPALDTTKETVELKIINNNDPTGQYYMDKVISGPNMIFGPKEIITASNKFAKPYQYLESQKSLVHANFLFSGILKENTSFNVDGKIATYAESNSNSEVFIPISKLDGRTYGLVLVANDNENKVIIKQIAKSIEFRD